MICFRILPLQLKREKKKKMEIPPELDLQLSSTTFFFSFPPFFRSSSRLGEHNDERKEEKRGKKDGSRKITEEVEEIGGNVLKRVIFGSWSFFVCRLSLFWHLQERLLEDFENSKNLTRFICSSFPCDEENRQTTRLVDERFYDQVDEIPVFGTACR